MGILKGFYDKIKYNTLQKLEKPFIFAYSSLVTKDILDKTKIAGFITCLSSPLTVGMVNQLIAQHLDAFAQHEIDNSLVDSF